MSKKCDTDKYRRRKKKEAENRKQREIRERDRAIVQSQRIAENRKWLEWQQEQAKITRWEYWRQDPVRYALLKRLVNVLNYKVQKDPLYRLEQHMQAVRRAALFGGLWY